MTECLKFRTLIKRSSRVLSKLFFISNLSVVLNVHTVKIFHADLVEQREKNDENVSVKRAKENSAIKSLATKYSGKRELRERHKQSFEV